MASGKGAATGGSGDEFPILCETCLGPNPYVRMTRHAWGSACKVCERPFTAFRWRPGGHGTRPKKTEVCQTCARSKNVCQTCLLDLQFGLPVQVRDVSLAAGDKQRAVVPQSDGTREYAAAQAERAIASGAVDAVYKAGMVNDVAERAKRKGPRYERNRARLCSFFLKGNCSRGVYCPYRHERPQTEKGDPMAEQNIRDRYYGVNDPVAAKIFRQAGLSSDGKRPRLSTQGTRKRGAPPPAPEDLSVRSLFIRGVTSAVNEKGLKELFAEVAEPRRVSVLAEKGIAFVDFETREAAEEAMSMRHGRQDVDGSTVYVNWGRSKANINPPLQSVQEQLIQSTQNRAKNARQPSSVLNQVLPSIAAPESTERPTKRGRPEASAEGGKVSVNETELREAPVEKADGEAKATHRKPLPAFPQVSDRSVMSKSALPPPLLYKSQDPTQLGSAVRYAPAMSGRENN